MYYVEGDNIVFFDVDNTLIMWNPDPNDPRVIDIPTLFGHWVGDGKFTPETMKVIPHKEHLERVKGHKRLGNTVVVWSKSGPRWAQHIVNHFGLQDYVDVVCGKPTCFYDDLKPEEFMGERRYIPQH